MIRVNAPAKITKAGQRLRSVFKDGCSQFGWYFIFIRISVCHGWGWWVGVGARPPCLSVSLLYILSLSCFGMGTALYTARAAFYDYTERKNALLNLKGAVVLLCTSKAESESKK